MFESHLKPLFGKVRSATWSQEDLKIYLEKYFIYQRDFKRITEFLPQKTSKDSIDLFYMIKKFCKFAEVEK